MRANTVRFTVVPAYNRAVVNAGHTTLKSVLADEAVISVFTGIADPENTAVKRRIPLGQRMNTG